MAPYGEAFDGYRRAGWVGVIPLPARRKAHPPKGTTGEAGVWPSYADCHAWADGPEGGGNIALRLPHHVVGIDVDNYDGKPGAATLAAAQERWGPLPATWRTTSRDDGTSGIRLFRIPEGLRWPGELGEATELIQYRHRYAVVWPSVHPQGRTYRWISPEGVTSTAIPDPDQLPPLPDAWVDGLTGGHRHEPTARDLVTADQARVWVVTRPDATGQPCMRMTRAVFATTTDLYAGTGSAHNAARDGALRAVRLADEGHAGLAEALAEIHRAFLAQATQPDRAGQSRTKGEAEREWGRLVVSAVGLVTASSTGLPACDCDGELTGLIVSGAYPTAGTAALTPLPTRPDPAQPHTSQLDPARPDQTQPDSNPTASDPTPSDPTSSDPARTESRTSWWPRDLAAVLAGEDDEPPPAVLARADGVRLFYAGKINALLGESESGKTWVALLAAAQTLAAGGQVAYLDFEDTPAGIVGRLRALSVPDEDLARLAYIGPDETLHAAASDDLREHLDQTPPDLIILDGVNAAMTLLGLDLTSNTDATRFTQLLLKPLAATGAAVVVIDHVPKARDQRGKGGIGAQAKRAMLTGSALTVEVAEPFGRGMIGRLRLYVDKDRAGHVRAACADARFAGTAVLASDADTGRVSVAVRPPDRTTTAERERGRHSLLMEEISSYLFEGPERTGINALRKVLGRRKEDIAAAVDELIARGHVERHPAPGRGGGYGHRLIRPFSIADDLTSPTPETGSDWFPPVPGNHGPGRPKPVPPTGPPLFRGGPGTGSAPPATRTHPPTTDPGSEPIESDGMLIDPRTGEVLGPAPGGEPGADP